MIRRFYTSNSSVKFCGLNSDAPVFSETTALNQIYIVIKLEKPAFFVKNIRETITSRLTISISLENLDTIQEEIYRISNLTIFEYNIFEKISAPKIWIRYFQKVSGPKIWIQSKKKFIVFLI